MMTTPTTVLQPEWSGGDGLTSANGQKQEAYRLAATEARKRRKELRSQAARPTKLRRSSSVMLVEPTIMGVREISRRWALGQTVAIPTECTYESVSLMTKLPSTQSGYQQPHVYVTDKSLNDLFEANQAHFPKRQYAFRKDGQVKAIAVFNETFEVVKRLASKIWPGPVVIAVALGPEGENESVVKTAGKDVYIQLRSPCHPLAVTSLQQYQFDPTTDLSKSILVGRPMILGDASSSVETYITDAASCLQLGTCTAILNGESPQELFHVPTCERGQPPSRVVVNINKRQVQVSSGSHLRLLQQTLQPLATSNTSSTTVQDRILQAVLQKWTVVQEGISCSVEVE